MGGEGKGGGEGWPITHEIIDQKVNGQWTHAHVHSNDGERNDVGRGWIMQWGKKVDINKMNEWKGEWEWHPSPFRKGWGKRGDKRGRKRIEPTHISTSHKGSFCSQEFGKTIAVLLNPCPLRQAYESPAFVSSLTTFSISSRSHWDVSLTISTSFGRKWQHGSFFFFFFFPLSIPASDLP